MPTTLLRAPRIFRPSYGPAYITLNITRSNESHNLLAHMVDCRHPNIKGGSYYYKRTKGANRFMQSDSYIHATAISRLFFEIPR